MASSLRGAAPSAAAALVLLAASCGGTSPLPECTYEACPVCLADARQKRVNLTLKASTGGDYSVPLRLGRCPDGWQSQALFTQIVGILAQERLGVNVAYVDGWDETQLLFAATNCAGWVDTRCTRLIANETDASAAFGDDVKLFPDPIADVLFAAEIPFSTFEDWTLSSTRKEFQGRSMNAGSTGFSSKDGLYVLEDNVKNCWSGDGMMCDFWRTYTTVGFHKHFSSPASLIAGGIVAEVVGCTSTEIVIQDSMTALAKIGWSCVDSWWLTPACAALGAEWKNKCLVALDDDWGSPKPAVYESMVSSNMLVARLVVGYGPHYDIVRSKAYNVSFLWWNTDSMFLTRNPVRISLQGDDVSSASDFPLNVMSSDLNVADHWISSLLDNAKLSYRQANWMLSESATAEEWATYEQLDAVRQKIACDWLRQNDNVWSQWLKDPKLCQPGKFYDDMTSSCEYCPRGKYSQLNRSAQTSLCESCWPGHHCPRGSSTPVPCSPGKAWEWRVEFGTNVSVCSPCREGFYQDEARALICKACPAGMYSYKRGSTECHACQPGSYSHTEGSRRCSSCQIGRFQSRLGASVCETCPDGLVTLHRQETEQSACVCPNDMFTLGGNVNGMMNVSLFESQTVQCKKCNSCMEPCEAGTNSSLKPRQRMGYYVRADTYSCYKCGSEKACPGGWVGACPPGAFDTSIGCSKCMLGDYYWDGDACVQCEPASLVLFILFCIVVTIVLLFTHWMGNSPIGRSVSHFSEVLAAAGLGWAYLFCLSSIATIAIKWEEPLHSLFKRLRIFTVDLGNSFGYTCTLRVDYPVVHALWSIVPLACFLVFAVVGGLKLAPWGKLFNTFGLSFHTCYILVVVHSLSCFQFVVHPSGERSLLRAPYILEFSDEWNLLLGISIANILVYGCGFFGLCVYACWALPRSSPKNAMKLLQVFRFLFNKFHPSAFYWGLVVLSRNAFIAVLPILDPGQPLLVTFIAMLLVAPLAVATSMVLPWRIVWANRVDVLLMLILQLFLLAGAASDEPLTQEDRWDISMIALSVVVLLVVVLVPMAVVAIISLLRGIRMQCTRIGEREVIQTILARREEVHLQETIRQVSFHAKSFGVVELGLGRVSSRRSRSTNSDLDVDAYMEKTATERSTASHGVLQSIPRGTRVCILGGTKFNDPDSDALVRAIARGFAAHLRSSVVVLTGGMPGVQEAFAKELGESFQSSLVNLLPRGQSSNYGVGVDLTAGEDLPARMKIFGSIGHIYLSFEGGPGVAKEARAAYSRGAAVLPLISTGGASSGMFEFPVGALERSCCITVEQWELIKTKGDPDATAAAVVDIVKGLTVSMEMNCHEALATFNTPADVKEEDKEDVSALQEKIHCL
eukprot:TRINITY_DN2737_c1_g1_i1.p1 TRINITY_DN2737_c1_g1~~TRINITY_DN2737_c1_g1_i1.p1  ORF type:complete len:1371 (+),score=152.13 TRINITY_DN2737_c1_g1_i1:25-4113(+)